jgi:hypothetical protein
MMRAALIMVGLFPALIRAEVLGMHEHYPVESASVTEPAIQISINPEARVSVVRAGALPPSVPCGTPASLEIKIVNQGFVTTPLEARLIDAPAGASLDFHPEPLKGMPQERRTLRITLIRPGETDLTVAFKAHRAIPDLGGRDRVHFLMHCVQS